jgi:hypothetical protein
MVRRKGKERKGKERKGKEEFQKKGEGRRRKIWPHVGV